MFFENPPAVAHTCAPLRRVRQASHTCLHTPPYPPLHRPISTEASSERPLSQTSSRKCKLPAREGTPPRSPALALKPTICLTCVAKTSIGWFGCLDWLAWLHTPLRTPPAHTWRAHVYAKPLHRRTFRTKTHATQRGRNARSNLNLKV